MSFGQEMNKKEAEELLALTCKLRYLTGASMQSLDFKREQHTSSELTCTASEFNPKRLEFVRLCYKQDGHQVLVRNMFTSLLIPLYFRLIKK